MRTRAFIDSLLVITLTAVAAAWFWALRPLITGFEAFGFSGTDADLVRHLWHFRLIQPEWVSKPPNYDYVRWSEAETLARLLVVFLGWVASSIFAYLTFRRKTPPNTALEPTPTAP